MSKLKLAAIALSSAMLLSACSSIWNNTAGWLLGREQASAADPTPQPLPNVKAIIANTHDEIFDASSNPRNQRISMGVRQIDAAGASDYGACLRADLTNRAGKDMGEITYVVTVHKDRVSDRRRAVPADGCDNEKYEPLR